MNTIWIVPIEPIDSRYTKQWYYNIPGILKEHTNGSKFQILTIDGKQPKTGTTEGAFLDFAVTNIYKATQVESISRLFSTGKIQSGDRFLVTDAWNFAITAIRYMSDLLSIPVEIHSIWHAGAYDPTDILGMKMTKPWPWHQEKAWYHASDYNYFATDFHKDMFLNNLGIVNSDKAIRSGQPHTPIVTALETYFHNQRDGSIIWPHRYNADKQPEIAEDLNQDLDLVITSNLGLSKKDYYKTLGRASAIFSCALHENLGISVMEAVLAGAVPIVPDRASYAEMYLPEFKYPSHWTESWESYQQHKGQLQDFILDRVQNTERYKELLLKQFHILLNNYLQPTVMVDKLLELK